MHSFQFTVSNKGRKGPVLTLWLKWNENPVKAHHSNRCTNKNNVVLISWSFNFSAIANGSNFGLCKVLTSWNYEKLGRKTIYFTVKSLTQRALICILAVIHHLTISQISPTHSLSLLFPLGWVSLGQNSGRKKNLKTEAVARVVLNGKSEEKAVTGIRFFHMIPEYMAWIPEQTCCLFTMQLLRTVWKGKDWKHGARIIKGSPKITGCTYWQQHSPEKADRKHSSTFDEKNKFCTFVKVFPPTLSLLFVFFRKTVSSSPVVLMFSSLK